MIKYIVLSCLLCSLEARASPSVSRIFAEGRGGATSPPAALSSVSEELSRAIERAVAAIIEQNLKEVPTTTTPMPTLMVSRDEIASVVSAAIKQAISDLTPASSTPSCSIEIANAVAPLKETVVNLTRSLDKLTTAVLTPPSTTTSAPAARCDCDEQVALCQLSVTNQTQTLTQKVAQTTPTSPHCVSGYEYSNVTGHCYKLHEETVRWTVADETCRREGGLLAVVNSREEALVLQDIRIRTSNPCYIGVYRNSDDYWITVTGEDVLVAAKHRVWTGGEPWTEAEWRYAVVYDDGTIGTRKEEDTRPFICEMAA